MTDQQFKKLNSRFRRLKTKLTNLEERFDDYTSSEQKEIRIFRLALSKLEDQMAALSSQGH